MKFLAFTDMHASRKAYEEIKRKIRKEKPDFVVCAGDFTFFHFHVDKILKALSQLHERVYLIHGNHEDGEEVKRISRKYKNLHFIHEKTEFWNGITFIGWGGGGFARRDGEFEKWSGKLSLKGIKIFVGHAPFFNTKLDNLGGHFGNVSFSSFIKKAKIDIGICGHFHENFGKEDMMGKCRVYNPGPRGKIIEI